MNLGVTAVMGKEYMCLTVAMGLLVKRCSFTVPSKQCPALVGDSGLQRCKTVSSRYIPAVPQQRGGHHACAQCGLDLTLQSNRTFEPWEAG